jgi:FtsP/CotA-like multicopper oxidase with cupredoxin domain
MSIKRLLPVWIGLRPLARILIAVVAAAVLVAPQMHRGAKTKAAGAIGIVCTPGPTFNLKTTTGFISTPDGNSLYMWGYSEAAGSFQMPGPVLCVNEGDTVTVNLTNTLPEPVSIVFPGQGPVTAVGGIPGVFTAEADAFTGTVSYTFVVSEAGTYLYESGTNLHKQVQMGLYGALVVRPALDNPAAGEFYAYNDPSTRFNPDREFLILLHEIDPSLHQAVEYGLPYDVTTLHDRYWTINGRSFPDTISDNFVSWLPSQPYGSMVLSEPFDAASNPLPALVRYANAGMFNHPFHPHGNHLRTIAQDGRLFVGPAGENLSRESFTRTIGAGQTYDILVSWNGTDPWILSGNPVPVQIPGLQDLVFKDGVTFYSGDPNLGDQGAFPAGMTLNNQCGEFYFPWHSHALDEFQNFDEGFGGLATLWRIDPPGGCP